MKPSITGLTPRDLAELSTPPEQSQHRIEADESPELFSCILPAGTISNCFRYNNAKITD